MRTVVVFVVFLVTGCVEVIEKSENKVVGVNEGMDYAKKVEMHNAKVEMHTASDYIYPVLKASEIVPGKMIIDKWTFKCPICQEEQPEPEHGIETTCPRCGLYILRYGNSLRLWQEEEK